VGSQVVHLAQQLPTYQNNIRAKIVSMQSAAPSGGAVDRATTVLRELGKELSQETEAEANKPAERPVLVRVEEPTPSPLEMVSNIAGPLLSPIATAGLVVVFVILMLLEREDLRDRLIRLVGGGNLYLTTEALDDAGRRISRYLLMQLVVNATYGLPIGIGLWLIGVPNALLWGVLATVLRFIPYVGPFMAALFPIALAIAVDPGWNTLLLTIALFLVMELVSNNFIEPWLYGSSTGISPLAIILAAIFWTMVWGPAGLLLSTPLTVCLAVMGRYIPQLQFLDILLGSEPVLSTEERFYQRMLAGDADEGEEIAKKFLQERPLAAFYDEVVLPALRLAELDRKTHDLADERRATVTDTCLHVVAELADYDDPEPAAASDLQGTVAPETAAGTPPAVLWTGKSVLCIAGRTGLDRVVAAMLAQLLERRGLGARVLPADAISLEGMSSLDVKGVELICLSYLSTSALAHARRVSRRLRRRAPEAKILLGLWNRQFDATKESDPASALSADLIATSLPQALEEIERLATVPTEAPMLPPPVPVHEEERLAALKSLNILDTPPEEAFDRVTRYLAKAFDAPISLLSLVDEYRQFWKSATGLPEDLAKARQAPRETSMCGHVVARDEVMVIEDVLKDKRFANNPFLLERGVRFYAGAPLRTGEGHAIGSLCVIDTKPRTISERERALLQMIANEVMVEIERRREKATPGLGADIPPAAVSAGTVVT
jgi:predicted PurR-regulated permease PerM